MSGLNPGSFGGLALGFTKISAGLLLLSLALFAYERTLIPIYGNAPTSFLFNKMLLATVAMAAVKPINVTASRNWLYAATLLYLAPMATYWVAVWTSRRKDPLWGPAVTHLVVLSPMVYTFSTFVVEIYVSIASPRRSFRTCAQGLESFR